tara:strand:+ start:433 stop:609 length:177 start_codon:yes stop_codon:yes gene_type:complete
MSEEKQTKKFKITKTQILLLVLVLFYFTTVYINYNPDWMENLKNIKNNFHAPVSHIFY